jgi:hypothetical protein
MNASDEAALAFNHAAEEIRFFKGQQWSITNYALLLQAGIVGAVELVKQQSLWCCWADVAAVLAIGLIVVAVWLLIALEAAICKERDRLEAARSVDLLPVVNRIHERKLPEVWRYTPFFVLVIVNVIAGVVAAFVVNLI